MEKKHPKGLWVCFMTELWERFGFYSLAWLLVLYMSKDLGWGTVKNGWYYGVFLGSVFAFNFIGGLVADRFIGQIKAIKIGAIVMIIGYVFVALSSAQVQWPFTVGLIFVVLGTGFLKGNISVMVGNLYTKENESMKDAGFNIYYMGINIGALLASVVISYVFPKSYNLSFWAAAAGMAVAAITFMSSQSIIRHADTKNIPKVAQNSSVAAMSQKEVYQRIGTLITMFLITFIFWICYYQNGSAMTYFADKSTQPSLNLGFVLWKIPAQFYSFFNTIGIILLTLTILPFYAFLNKMGKEPSTAGKIFYGMIIMGITMIIMVIASLLGGNSNTNCLSPLWLIGTYLVVSLAEILISPMGLSFVSKVAPPRWQGMMMGLWFFVLGSGGLVAGVMSAYYDKLPHHLYFLILTALSGLSGILVLVFMKKLNKFAV